MKPSVVTGIRERLGLDYMKATQDADVGHQQAIEDVTYLLSAYDAACSRSHFYIRLYVESQRWSFWTHLAAALAGAIAVGVAWLM